MLNTGAQESQGIEEPQSIRMNKNFDQMEMLNGEYWKQDAVVYL